MRPERVCVSKRNPNYSLVAVALFWAGKIEVLIPTPKVISVFYYITVKYKMHKPSREQGMESRTL